MSDEKNITVCSGQVGRLHADKSKSTAVFLKLHTELRIKHLKGPKSAPLSAFMCSSLHMDDTRETSVSNPTISKETGYVISSIKSAKKFLIDNDYLNVKKEDITFIKSFEEINFEEISKLINHG